MQQTFGEPEVISDEDHILIMKSASTYYSNMSEATREIALNAKDSKRVHLLMPLRGRSSTFKRFCQNMLDVLPPSEKEIELVLILYR